MMTISGCVKGQDFMKKKLTNTKGFPLVMVIIAFLLSALSVLQEFIAINVYKSFFDNPTYNYVLTSNKMEFFNVYNSAMVLFVLSFIIMVVFVAGAKKKTIGYKEGVLVAFSSIAIAVPIVLEFIYFLKTITFKSISNMGDGGKFRTYNELISYCVPLLVCLFLLLAGFGLIIKVKSSKAYVQIIDETPEPVINQPSALNPLETNEQKVFDQAAAPAMAHGGLTDSNNSEMIKTVIKPEKSQIKQQSDDASVETDIKESQNAVLHNIKCSGCGKDLPAGIKFCRYCGVKIN